GFRCCTSWLSAVSYAAAPADADDNFYKVVQAITEPERLLNEYRAHLSEHGGIMPESIPHLLELMKSTNGKLVPKCIALCIISASVSDVQSKLCKEGAWDILLKWLQEALKEDNVPFLMELLNVYLVLPVRLEQLTQNVCPKLINSLTKRCEHDAVRVLAGEIVKKWKGVISSDSKRLESRLSLVTYDFVAAEPKKKRLDIIPKSDDPLSTNELKHDKKRPRTVKMPPTLMRTAGVEDVPHTHPKSRSEVLAKKSKLDMESKLISELPIESFHQKITVTPTEPRKVVAEIHESPDFINALTTTPCSVVRKKRKLPPLKPEVFPSSDLIQVRFSDFLLILSSSTEKDSPSPCTSGMGTKKSSMTSLSSSFSSENRPKKRVSWADEDKLQSFFYFELDESERVNVNRVSVDDIRRKELSLERQLFKRNNGDALISSQKWHTPLPLERIFLVEPGYKSSERQIQTERERYVLQAIYFTRESIPPSAEEPDSEIVEPSVPLDIPLEDVSVHLNFESSNFTFFFSAADPLLVVKDAMGSTQMSLNPEVADLVKSLAANLSATPSVITASSSVTPENSQPVFAPKPLDSTVPWNEPNHVAESGTASDQSLQRELWDVLEENYPDLNVRELSADRIRDLLEPLRDQLVARGIFQLPYAEKYPVLFPPPQLSPPRPHSSYGMRPGLAIDLETFRRLLKRHHRCALISPQKKSLETISGLTTYLVCSKMYPIDWYLVIVKADRPEFPKRVDLTLEISENNCQSMPVTLMLYKLSLEGAIRTVLQKGYKYRRAYWRLICIDSYDGVEVSIKTGLRVFDSTCKIICSVKIFIRMLDDLCLILSAYREQMGGLELSASNPKQIRDGSVVKVRTFRSEESSFGKKPDWTLTIILESDWLSHNSIVLSMLTRIRNAKTKIGVNEAERTKIKTCQRRMKMENFVTLIPETSKSTGKECRFDKLSNKPWLYGSEASVFNTDVMLSMVMNLPYLKGLFSPRFCSLPTQSLLNLTKTLVKYADDNEVRRAHYRTPTGSNGILKTQVSGYKISTLNVRESSKSELFHKRTLFLEYGQFSFIRNLTLSISFSVISSLFIHRFKRNVRKCCTIIKWHIWLASASGNILTHFLAGESIQRDADAYASLLYLTAIPAPVPGAGKETRRQGSQQLFLQTSELLVASSVFGTFAVAPFRYLTAIPPNGSTRTGILPVSLRLSPFRSVVHETIRLVRYNRLKLGVLSYAILKRFTHTTY
ncbi:serine/threonine-protein phosphatase 1 regulatory subunit 10, partial [Clonorchis sinensis]